MREDDKAQARPYLRLVGGTDVAARSGRADGPLPSVAPAQSGVSLMVTRRQKDQLRALGFTDETIKTMTPTEAHVHLGI